MARLRRNPKCGDRVVKTHRRPDSANYGGIQHTCIEHLKQPGGKSQFGFQYSLTANLASMLLYCHRGRQPWRNVALGRRTIFSATVWCVSVAGNFITKQHPDFVQKLAEALGGTVVLTHERQFMLDKWMTNQMDVIGLHKVDPRSSYRLCLRQKLSATPVRNKDREATKRV